MARVDYLCGRLPGSSLTDPARTGFRGATYQARQTDDIAPVAIHAKSTSAVAVRLARWTDTGWVPLRMASTMAAARNRSLSPRPCKNWSPLRVWYQNDFIEDMYRFRDEGPAYPYVIIGEFAKITFMEQRGADNDEVINAAPGQLPDG